MPVICPKCGETRRTLRRDIFAYNWLCPSCFTSFRLPYWVSFGIGLVPPTVMFASPAFLEWPYIIFSLAIALATMSLLRYLAINRHVFQIIKLGPGFCQHCGYNLQGLGSERCPECGTEFSYPAP